MSDPSMQSCTYSPHKHAARNPGYHAKLSSQRCAHRLKTNEESKEQSNRCVHVTLFQPDVAREMRRFSISNLEERQ